MNRLGHPAPAQYELRVEGHLDEHWSTWFGGMALTREGDGTTTLRGKVADQAELHGLLAKVRDIGVPLISVETTDTPERAGGRGGSELNRGVRPFYCPPVCATRLIGDARMSTPASVPVVEGFTPATMD